MADAAIARVPAPTENDRNAILVGSGGTIANLAGMEAGASETSIFERHGARLSRDQIEARAQTLAAQTLAERRQTPALNPTAPT
jgi:exopolyphosphatase/pppGpp-phosphohydrolase